MENIKQRELKEKKDIVKIVSAIDGIVVLVQPKKESNSSYKTLTTKDGYKSIKIYKTKNLININIYIEVSYNIKANMLMKTVTSAIYKYYKELYNYSKSKIKISIYIEGITNA